MTTYHEAPEEDASSQDQPMFRPRAWYERFPYVCTAIAVASITLLTLYWSFSKHPDFKENLFTFILKEAGMAGLIALFLNISIEWVARRKHEHQTASLLGQLESKHEETSRKLLRDVNQQLFKTVYQRDVDPVVFRQVEKHLLNANFMRRDFVVSFKLKRFDDPVTDKKTGLVLINYTNDYKLHNLTDRSVKGVVAIAKVDVTPAFREHCKFTRVSIGGVEIPEQELADCVVPVEDRNMIFLKIHREIDANDFVAVRVEYQKLAPDNYSEVIVTTMAMDRLAIDVSDPEECFTIDAVSLHPEDEKRVTPPTQKHLLKWTIEAPILPGQGLVMFWHLTNDTAKPGIAKSLELTPGNSRL